MHALKIDDSNRDRTGIIIGTGIGGVGTMMSNYDVLKERGADRVSPFLIPMMISDSAAGILAIRTGARGPNMSIATACATGTNALGEAAGMIRRGAADIMLVGSAEGAIVPLAMAGLNAMTALSTRNDEPEHASRPFDRERDGFLMGEGAAMLVLESLESAERRGVRRAVRIQRLRHVGRRLSHLRARRRAAPARPYPCSWRSQDAGLQPADIGYINAHGTSTRLNDKSETLAVKKRLWRAGLSRADLEHQVDDRSSAGGLGFAGGRHLRPGAERGDPAAHHQLRIPGSRLRPGLRAERRPPGRARARDVQLVRFRRPQRHVDPEQALGLNSRAGTPRGGSKRSGPEKDASMPYAHITGWGMSVPDTVLTNDELAQRVDTNDKWIREMTGIRERRIAKDREYPSTLAVKASIQGPECGQPQAHRHRPDHLCHLQPGVHLPGHGLPDPGPAGRQQSRRLRPLGCLHRVHLCHQHGRAGHPQRIASRTR